MMSFFILNFKIISHLVLVFLLWSLSMYLFALCELYILIFFRFDGFKFHSFLERISTKWNAQGADLKNGMENAFQQNLYDET